MPGGFPRQTSTSHPLDPPGTSQSSGRHLAPSSLDPSSATRGVSLPPLPSISPISFGISSPADTLPTPKAKKSSGDSLGPAGPLPVPPLSTAARSEANDGDTIAATDATATDAPAPSATLASAPSTPSLSDKTRLQSPPLSIYIPRSSSPSYMPVSDDLMTVKQSPNIARKLQVVQANPSMRVTSGRAAAMGSISSDEDSPTSPVANGSDMGSMSMPVAQPLRSDQPSTKQDLSASQGSRISQASQRSQASQTSRQSQGARAEGPLNTQLEKKLSITDNNENKDSSPRDSPTPRRSLPRPPVSQRTSAPPPLNLAKSQHPTAAPAQSPGLPSQQSMNSLYGQAAPAPAPAPVNGTLGRSAHAANYGTPQTLQIAANYNGLSNGGSLKSPDLPQVMPTSRHTPAKSASSIPVVGGLADAGPYPSASPNPPPQSTLPPNPPIGMGRPGQPSAIVRRPKPQEEICIECMMRDRDLADVDVTGEHVWDRQSDVDFEMKKEREQDILRTVGSESRPPSAIPSLVDLSLESDEESFPSTHHSMDEQEMKRRVDSQNARREQKRARKRELDWKIASIGWRGFKWEEGERGEGLPKGFRGSRGGPLTEEGIKQVMLKVSSLRFLQVHVLMPVPLWLAVPRNGYGEIPLSPGHADQGDSDAGRASGSLPRPRRRTCSSLDIVYRQPRHRRWTTYQLHRLGIQVRARAWRATAWRV